VIAAASFFETIEGEVFIPTFLRKTISGGHPEISISD
jgi:hypothetical protein